MRPPSERFEKSMTSDNLWIYILTLLKRKDMYPYGIKKEIEKEYGFRPGNVTAYIVLKKLKVGGYVKAAGKDKRGGPQRNYYGITEKGRKELERARRIYRRLGGRWAD